MQRFSKYSKASHLKNKNASSENNESYLHLRKVKVSVVAKVFALPIVEEMEAAEMTADVEALS